METIPYKQTEEYRLTERVRRKWREGIREFGLIAPGDHILVGLSGGKDSLALMELLGETMRHSNRRFRVSALHVRMAGIDYRSDLSYLERMARESGIPLLVRTAAFEPDRKERRTPCFLCSWTRRKMLFQTARELGCNKIALGHHQDDILQTALMNLTYAGSFATMPALLRMRKFPQTLIRPLCKVPESDLRAWAVLRGYQPLVKLCPHETASRRADLKGVFSQLENLAPEFRYSLWHALQKEGKLTEEEGAAL